MRSDDSSRSEAVNSFGNERPALGTDKRLAPVSSRGPGAGDPQWNPEPARARLQEMVQLVRSKPGQFNYGLPGSMTSGHLSMELLKVIAGLDMVAVPYKGGAPAAADLAAGQVQFMINSPPTVLPFVKAGRVRSEERR